MKNRLLRTFISIPVPNSVKNVKQMLTSTCEDEKVIIHWVKHNNLHITLQFLGFTPEKDIPQIKEVLSKITKSQKVFDLTIANTGKFPDSDKPSVLYLGVNGNLKLLNELVNNIIKEISSIGYDKEVKEYIPYVTVGKINYPQKFNPDLSTFLNSSYDKIDFTVDKIQFISSETLQEGVIHSILNTFSFLEN
tara:strand:- start:333 stop:908 length:576 start_codon:yes stop_codon:yes gene_type:complete